MPRDGPERGPGGDVYPQPPAPPPGDRITVYATVAVRTSAGPGPGVLDLPAAEANRLIGMKYGLYGDRPGRSHVRGQVLELSPAECSQVRSPARAAGL